MLTPRRVGGFVVPQVVGGTMSDRLGGKPVMTMSLLATGLCTAIKL